MTRIDPNGSMMKLSVFFFHLSGFVEKLQDQRFDNSKHSNYNIHRGSCGRSIDAEKLCERVRPHFIAPRKHYEKIFVNLHAIKWETRRSRMWARLCARSVESIKIKENLNSMISSRHEFQKNRKSREVQVQAERTIVNFFLFKSIFEDFYKEFTKIVYFALAWLFTIIRVVLVSRKPEMTIARYCVLRNETVARRCLCHALKFTARYRTHSCIDTNALGVERNERRTYDRSVTRMASRAPSLNSPERHIVFIYILTLFRVISPSSILMNVATLFITFL